MQGGGLRRSPKDRERFEMNANGFIGRAETYGGKPVG